MPDVTEKKSSHSMFRHVIAHVFLVQLFLLPAIFYVSAYLVKEQIQNRFIDDLQTHSMLIAKRLEDIWGNSAKIQRALAQEVSTGKIAYAYISNKGKKRLFEEGFPPLKGYLQDNTGFNQNLDGVFDISVPLHPNGNNIPIKLHIGFNEGPLTHLIVYIQQRFIYFATIYLLISALFTALFSRTVTRPLQHLRMAIRRVTNGNQHDEIYTHSPIREFKGLAQDLNTMRTELVSQTQQLRHQATHDTLTGLPNRALCMDRISQAMALSQRKRKAFVLMLLDLDQFKEINDTLGHKAGDMLLEVTASRLSRIIRRSDSVARLGGDEFAILLPTADASQASIVAQKALRSIQKPFHFEDRTLHIQASIGAAIYPDHGKSVGDLLHSADVAMYHAKRGGHGFTMHHSKLGNSDAGSLTLTSDLKDALEQEEIILYYQPKLDIKTETITGVETLIRWQHHKRGLIFPDEFIPAAENSNIINEMTLYIISKAIQQCTQWIRDGLNITVAVNISAKNLLDPGFSSAVFSLLERYALPPNYLEIELTESAVLNDPDLAKETLSRFSHKGIQVSLDDFGAGNTSLAHFLELPLDTIKIDKSFVTDITRNTHRQSIVHRIIDMAQALDLKTVVEGIENEQELKIIDQLGGDAAQGYVLSKPLPNESFITWLKGQHLWKYATL